MPRRFGGIGDKNVTVVGQDRFEAAGEETCGSRKRDSVRAPAGRPGRCGVAGNSSENSAEDGSVRAGAWDPHRKMLGVSGIGTRQLAEKQTRRLNAKTH